MVKAPTKAEAKLSNIAARLARSAFVFIDPPFPGVRR
jgi:16S rRNA G966 N2-methylase RsmD